MSLSLFHRSVAALFILFAAEGTVSAEALPRKTKIPRESYPNSDVISGSMVGPRVVAAIFVVVGVGGTVSAEELPGKTKIPRESYPNVDVIYDSIVAPQGKRLRTIITKTQPAQG